MGARLSSFDSVPQLAIGKDVSFQERRLDSYSQSILMARSGSLIDRSWFALRTSRGLDDQSLKVFMRATVIISEYLTYVPATVILVRSYSSRLRVSRWHTSIALTAILMQPGIILIDHAHFQYNTVMLGFVLASMACMITNHLLWSCVFFMAGLGFKQMALYYAPAVFAFLLGSCIIPRIDAVRLMGLGVFTLISFGSLYVPLLLGTFYDQFRGVNLRTLEAPPLLQALNLNTEAFHYPFFLQIAQSVHRVFPFARGLFEDKVANFWCAVHTFHKLHRYPKEILQRVSLGATAASIVPPTLLISMVPDSTHLPAAFATTAWGFFLFSFQVHEKSVLLPLVPMTLLLAGPKGLDAETRAWVSWANTLGCWTMFPLLKRDELRMPYGVLTLLWTWLMGQPSMLFSQDRPLIFTQLLHGLFYVTMIVWHFAEHFVPQPENKPDLWVVANVLVGTGGFGICYIWCLWQLIQGTFERKGWFQSNSKKTSRTTSKGRKAQ